MGTELVNVEAFNKGPAQAFKVEGPATSLADGIGQSYGVISYKGKVWSVRHRGVRKNVVRPDDGTPSSYLDVIILDAADHKSKSYYKDFVDGDSAPPLCSAMDGITPDHGVPQKQAESCALCPRNEWKLMPNGKKGRDCTDYKRLVVLLLPNTSRALFGEPLMEPIFLRVPPASLNALAQMGEQMDSRGYPYYSYITRISFDPNEAHPKMVFKGLQPLTDAEAPLVLALRKDPIAGRIINGDVALPAITHQPAADVTAPVTVEAKSESPLPVTSTSAPSSPAPTAPVSSSAKSDVVPPVTLVANPQTTAAISEPPSVVDTGFGGVTTASTDTKASEQTPTSSTSTASQVIDTGEPTEADADLDAKIANLLK